MKIFLYSELADPKLAPRTGVKKALRQPRNFLEMKRFSSMPQNDCG